MIRAALCALLALTGCGMPLYQDDGDVIRLTFGAGGDVARKRRVYEALEAGGRRVVIDGQMISADAFLAFSLSNACYTERAVFSPHAASTLGLFPNYPLTQELADDLPEGLRAWFNSNHARWDWIGYAEVDYAGLLELWPEGACVNS